MSIGIYKITSPKGKTYIGQSFNIEKRFKAYRSSLAYGQPKLNKSFIKYGIENHTFEIIEICEECKLNERECFYIKKMDLFKTDKGLNCRSGGAFGRHSEFSKELNRQAHIGKKQSKETIEKRFKNLIGKKRDEKIGAKISKTKKGVKFSETHKNNLRLSLLSSEKFKEAHLIKTIKKGKKVINIQSGIIYNSAKEAASKEGINQHTLTPKLNGNFKNNTNLKYLVD